MNTIFIIPNSTSFTLFFMTVMNASMLDNDTKNYFSLLHLLYIFFNRYEMNKMFTY